MASRKPAQAYEPTRLLPPLLDRALFLIPLLVLLALTLLALLRDARSGERPGASRRPAAERVESRRGRTRGGGEPAREGAGRRPRSESAGEYDPATGR